MVYKIQQCKVKHLLQVPYMNFYIVYLIITIN